MTLESEVSIRNIDGKLGVERKVGLKQEERERVKSVKYQPSG